MKRIFIIKTVDVNYRLDKWFKKEIHDVPQALIEKSIRKGNIKVNKKKVKSSFKLSINDKIEIYNINFKISIKKKNKVIYIPNKNEIRSSSSIFIENNENFAVINKPSGIAVQSGTKSKKNIIDILRKSEEFSEAIPFTVHRIDKETTGILIVAKNREYAQLFTSLFRIRKIHKTYLGIVLGEVQKKKGTLTDELVQYEGDKKILTKAITNFSVIDSNNNYSLLELSPITGRKHQLRKQLLLFGHPILGDSKYRFIKKNLMKKNDLMLHAYKINFSISNVKYKFSADIPLSFKNTLKEKFLKIF